VAGWQESITLPVTVYGGEGNDQIITDAGDDVIVSGAGHDLIDARGGRNATDASSDDLLVRSSGAAYVDGTQLVIEGTLFSDKIELIQTTPDVLDVWVNGVMRTFQSSQFESIRIEGGNGDDVIGMGVPSGAAWRATIPMIVHGGAGDDAIAGGSGADLLDGGAGDDVLRGSGGADTLAGGDGDDAIYSSRHSGPVFGGAGENVIWGYVQSLGYVAIRGDDRTGVVEFQEDANPDDGTADGSLGPDDGSDDGEGATPVLAVADRTQLPAGAAGASIFAVSGSIFGSDEARVWEDEVAWG
jgi:hypothetical protein